MDGALCPVAVSPQAVKGTVMASPSVWSGFIRFSLVAVSVKAFTAGASGQRVLDGTGSVVYKRSSLGYSQRNEQS